MDWYVPKVDRHRHGVLPHPNDVCQLTGEWPRKGKLRHLILQNMEKYLTVGEHVTKIHSYAGVSWTDHTDRMPNVLSRVMGELMATIGLGADLHEEIPQATADELWNRVCSRTHELAGQGLSVPTSDPATADSWHAFLAIAVTVAEGMTYAALPIRTWLDERNARNDGVWTVETSPQRRNWQQALAGLELFMVSAVNMVTKDLRRLDWLARQPLRQGLRGMCRHYSTIVQVLFDAAKRATGRFGDAYVITNSGRPRPWAPYGHAWTWFVDASKDIVVATDLTGADWLLDRGQAGSIFNQGFDGTRWNNVSAFLTTLSYWYDAEETPLYQSEAVQELFPQAVDLETIRGQALAYNICQQFHLHDEIRARIVNALDQRGFGRLFPGWRFALRATKALERLDHMASQLGDAGTQHLLWDSVLDK